MQNVDLCGHLILYGKVIVHHYSQLRVREQLSKGNGSNLTWIISGCCFWSDVVSLYFKSLVGEVFARCTGNLNVAQQFQFILGRHE